MSQKKNAGLKESIKWLRIMTTPQSTAATERGNISPTGFTKEAALSGDTRHQEILSSDPRLLIDTGGPRENTITTGIPKS